MKVICKHGLPSHAFEDIIFRDGHVLAWDRRNRIPLWVAQHLSSSSLAAAKAAAEARKLKRHSNFTEEPSIPDVFKSKLSDYKGSGYDRGHMVPAADAKLTDASYVRPTLPAMQNCNNLTRYNATFILTNIAPQVGKGFNQDYWERLERMCRGLTRDWDDVWVITGPAFLPKKEGNIWMVRYEVLGDPEPNVAVPTHFWKVILPPSTPPTPNSPPPSSGYPRADGRQRRRGLRPSPQRAIDDKTLSLKAERIHLIDHDHKLVHSAADPW